MLDLQRFWEVVLFSWMTGNSDMHCKNFSIIDIGDREYILAPAYDLLAVWLADPSDTEEMAMAFTVGGEKKGFDRTTFLTAMIQSGIEDRLGERIIRRMCSFRPQWEELIGMSFLPDTMKDDYLKLIDSRIRLL